MVKRTFIQDVSIITLRSRSSCVYRIKMYARAKGCVVEKSESMRTMRSVYDIAQLCSINKLQNVYQKKNKKKQKEIKKKVLTCIIVKFENA